jgi:UDP-GlcNAc:undecaprenyl-phosphate GlcNAc-1-phosphate transferase
MGGIAIAGATLIGFVVVVAQPALGDGVAPWVSVLTASLAMFAIGIFDDRLQLSPLAKLVASLGHGCLPRLRAVGRGSGRCVSVAVHADGDRCGSPGICHAVNLLDNMDGLAAGVAAIRGALLRRAARAPRSARRS